MQAPETSCVNKPLIGKVLSQKLRVVGQPQAEPCTNQDPCKYQTLFCKPGYKLHA